MDVETDGFVEINVRFLLTELYIMQKLQMLNILNDKIVKKNEKIVLLLYVLNVYFCNRSKRE